MKYILSYKKPNIQYLHIEIEIQSPNDIQEIQLPAWRPGRYELGNFAKNVKSFQAKNEEGEILITRKISKDTWEIQCNGAANIKVEYDYYAALLNAGSTYLDPEMLYVNPVNCLMYIPERINSHCTIQIQVPDTYEIAIGLQHVSATIFEANDFHELADSPFIASPTLKHEVLSKYEVDFHFWFQGEVNPEWPKILADMEAIIDQQMEMMGSFPVKEYHFLYHISIHGMYHGVEHLNSTVICLGPVFDLFKDRLYPEFIGISSHELYHAWNIKAIRPADLLPYDYTKENYTELGYVAEGVTTYLGDYFVLKAGVFGQYDFFRNLNSWLTKYVHNFGRLNYSVAQSSWDTWLDGYESGVPQRKVSIYNEGALLALLADLIIRKHSKEKYSLGNVMRSLYDDFALQNKGYTRNNYKELLEKYAGVSFSVYFDNLVEGTTGYFPFLEEYFDYIGLQIVELPSEKLTEKLFGLKTKTESGKVLVTAIHMDSPAERSGLMINDEIRTINNMRVTDNLNEWMAQFENQAFELTVNRNGITRKIRLEGDGKSYYGKWEASKNPFATAKQKAAYRSWANAEF